MVRMVPSAVKQFIDNDSVLSRCTDPDPKKQPDLGYLQASELSALLHLLDEIPEELTPTQPDAYVDFVLGRSAIYHAVQVWRSGDQKTILKPLKRWGGLNAVALVHRALGGAPDEAPAATTKTLAFITDAAARTTLQNDVAAVERAIHNSEWKAATVLAGSVIEALLLWALSQDAHASRTATAAPKKDDLRDWHLFELIRVAKELKLISDRAARQADLARDFRNLIHPAVAERARMQCDRPTAFGTFAAMDLVAADLEVHLRASRAR